MKIKSTVAPFVVAAMLGCSGMSMADDDDVSAEQAAQLVEAGTIMSLDDLNEVALALHPGATIEDSELERESTRYVYQLELHGDTLDEEWDVALDASTGEVLSDRRDN